MTVKGDFQTDFYFIDLDAGDSERNLLILILKKYRRVNLSSSSDIDSTINIKPRKFDKLSILLLSTIFISTVDKNEYKTIIDFTNGSKPESDKFLIIEYFKFEKARSERREKNAYIRIYIFAYIFCG